MGRDGGGWKGRDESPPLPRPPPHTPPPPVPPPDSFFPVCVCVWSPPPPPPPPPPRINPARVYPFVLCGAEVRARERESVKTQTGRKKSTRKSALIAGFPGRPRVCTHAALRSPSQHTHTYTHTARTGTLSASLPKRVPAEPSLRGACRAREGETLATPLSTSTWQPARPARDWQPTAATPPPQRQGQIRRTHPAGEERGRSDVRRGPLGGGGARCVEQMHASWRRRRRSGEGSPRPNKGDAPALATTPMSKPGAWLSPPAQAAHRALPPQARRHRGGRGAGSTHTLSLNPLPSSFPISHTFTARPPPGSPGSPPSAATSTFARWMTTTSRTTSTWPA